VTQEEYGQAAQEWAKQTKNEGSGGNYYYSQLAYLGSQYVKIVFNGYYKNRFDLIQLAEYLNIKPKNVSAFEETYTRISS